MTCDREAVQHKRLRRGIIYVLRARVSRQRHIRSNKRSCPIKRIVLVEKSSMMPTKSNTPKYINHKKYDDI